MNTPRRHGSLSDRLSDRAGQVDLGPPVIDLVVARGRQRQHRRRTAVGVTAVVCIGTGSIAAINVLSRPNDPDRVVAALTDDSTGNTAGAPDTAPPSGTPLSDPVLIPSPFVWNRVDPDSSEAVSFYMGAPDNSVAGTGPFVVWSTAPAVSPLSADYSGALWRSDDGLSWEQVTSPPTLTGRNVAELDGRFLTYGTAPAAAAGRRSDLAIGVSDDAGRTWTTTLLPLDTSAILAEAGVTSVGVAATSIAATSAGVLASAQVTADIDVQSKLPAEVRDLGWEYTESGIRVPNGESCSDVTVTTISFGGSQATSTTGGTATTSPGSCTYRTYTWAELGVSERAARAWIRPEVRFLFSTDGVTFTEISPVGIDPAATDVRLVAVGDSFAASVAIATADGGAVSHLLSSADGRSWSDLGTTPVSYIEGFGAIGDRLVVSGYDYASSTQVVAVRDPSGNWTTTSLNSLVFPADGVKAAFGGSSMAIGPNGISMIGALFVDQIAEAGGVIFSKDGITVEIDDESYSHRVIDDVTGDVLASVTFEASSNPDLVTIVYGDQGPTIEVRREPGGDLVTTYTYEDLSNAVATAIGAQPAGPKIFLLHSPDGASWSRDSLDEIAGEAIAGTGGIRLTDSQVIVAANRAGERNSNGTPKQTLLIGTLAS